jgi:hypothetical protein
MPVPQSYDKPIHDLGLALDRLAMQADIHGPINKQEIHYANRVLAKMTTAGGYLEDGNGRAAMEFKRNFLDPFPALCGNQFTLIAIAKAALEAHRSMWESARDDIDHIVHATLDALENQGCCDPNRWTLEFTVVASVAAIAAVPLTEVALGVGMAVAAVGAASQVIAAAPPQAPKVEYAGETVKQVIEQMKHAVSKLEVEIRNTEGTIQRALDQTNQQISLYRNSFVARRPALADSRPDNVTGMDYLGTS